MSGMHHRNGNRHAPAPRRHSALPPLKRPDEMTGVGRIKWFDARRGFGFIKRDGSGGGEVFLHASTVAQYGLTDRQLEPDTPVRFHAEDPSDGRRPVAGAICIAP